MNKSFFCGVVPNISNKDSNGVLLSYAKIDNPLSEYIPLASYLRGKTGIYISVKLSISFAYEDLIQYIKSGKKIFNSRKLRLKSGHYLIGDFMMLTYPLISIGNGTYKAADVNINVSELVRCPDILFCMVCKRNVKPTDLVISKNEEGHLINSEHVEFWVSPGFDHKDTDLGGLRKVYRKYLLPFLEEIGIEPKEKEDINNLFIHPLYPMPKADKDYDNISKTLSREIMRKEKRLLMYNLEL